MKSSKVGPNRKWFPNPFSYRNCEKMKSRPGSWSPTARAPPPPPLRSRLLRRSAIDDAPSSRPHCRCCRIVVAATQPLLPHRRQRHCLALFLSLQWRSQSFQVRYAMFCAGPKLCCFSKPFFFFFLVKWHLKLHMVTVKSNLRCIQSKIKLFFWIKNQAFHLNDAHLLFLLCMYLYLSRLLLRFQGWSRKCMHAADFTWYLSWEVIFLISGI